MAYPEFFSHVVLTGTLPAGEKWATGWWQTESEDPGGWDFDSWQERVTQYEAAMHTGDGGSALLAGLQALASTGTTFDRVTGYLYGASDADAALFSAEQPIAGGVVGTGTAVHPSSVACVLGWRAGAGSSHRGRSFLVANGADLDPAGRFFAAQLNGVTQGFTSFYRELAVPSIYPIVVSKTHSDAYQVRYIETDNIPDVHRSRVDALAPTVTSQANMPVSP